MGGFALADYYTAYSFKVNEMTPDDLAFATALEGALTEQRVSGESLESLSLDVDVHAAAKYFLDTVEEPEYWTINFGSDGTDLWFFDEGDEGTDIDAVVTFLQAILRHKGSDRALGFEWANSCSKPRLDAFSGGAVVFNKDDRHYMWTGDWVSRKLVELETGGDSADRE